MPALLQRGGLASGQAPAPVHAFMVHSAICASSSQASSLGSDFFACWWCGGPPAAHEDLGQANKVLYCDRALAFSTSLMPEVSGSFEPQKQQPKVVPVRRSLQHTGISWSRRRSWMFLASRSAQAVLCGCFDTVHLSALQKGTASREFVLNA